MACRWEDVCDVESDSDIPSEDDIPTPPERKIILSPSPVPEAQPIMPRSPKRKKRTKAKFRFNAGRVALTYSQCGDLSSERVVAFLNAKYGVKHYFVRRCEHDDDHEGWHIHAYIEFKSKLDLASERLFDIDGYHPNIKEIKRRNKGREGWLKYIDEENTGEDIVKDIERDQRGIQKWAFEAIRIGNERGTEAAWQFLKDTEPARCLEKGGQLKANLMMVLRPPVTYTPFYPQGITLEEPCLDAKQRIWDWWNYYVLGAESRRRFKLLVVKSPGSWGKTEWVRCLDPDPAHHAYFANRFNCNGLDDNQRYWIWEDVDFWDSQFKSKKALLTGNASKIAEADGKWIPQMPVAVKPSIWLCNSIPFDRFQNLEERQWWYDESIIVELTCPLFNGQCN